MAQRRNLFRWKLRGRKRLDLVISGARARWQMGNCAKTSDQRFQPRQDRQIGHGTEGRKIDGERVARKITGGTRGGASQIFGRRQRGALHHFNFSPVNLSNASTYFAAVRAITSPGSFGPGGVLFQSSVSR